MRDGKGNGHGFLERSLGIYERTKKILAAADHSFFAVFRSFDYIHQRNSDCTFYLYVVLKNRQISLWMVQFSVYLLSIMIAQQYS